MSVAWYQRASGQLQKSITAVLLIMLLWLIGGAPPVKAKLKGHQATVVNPNCQWRPASVHGRGHQRSATGGLQDTVLMTPIILEARHLSVKSNASNQVELKDNNTSSTVLQTH